MKSPKTIITAKQLAEMRGYEDNDKLIEEASKAGVLFEQAGTPHIWVEGWDEYTLKVAASQLSSRSRSSKSLADTNQLGIINSNLKRLPESIRIKERKLRAKEALYESAETENEKYIISGEISKLREDLDRHRENLKAAQQRQKVILAERSAELKEYESKNSDSSKEVSVQENESSEK